MGRCCLLLYGLARASALSFSRSCMEIVGLPSPSVLPLANRLPLVAIDERIDQKPTISLKKSKSTTFPTIDHARSSKYSFLVPWIPIHRRPGSRKQSRKCGPCSACAATAASHSRRRRTPHDKIRPGLSALTTPRKLARVRQVTKWLHMFRYLYGSIMYCTWTFEIWTLIASDM